MLYKMYSYKSKLFEPELSEAKCIIEDLEKHGNRHDPALVSSDTIKIIGSLLRYNAHLDYHSHQDVQYHRFVDVPRSRLFNEIVFKTPKTEPAIQITVLQNIVILESPYSYVGDEAIKLFTALHQYTEVLRKAVSYFVYDPQANIVYDPWRQKIPSLSTYNQLAEEEAELQKAKLKRKKWWHFG